MGSAAPRIRTLFRFAILAATVTALGVAALLLSADNPAEFTRSMCNNGGIDPLEDVDDSPNSESDPETAGESKPEELSTDPALRWAEVDPGASKMFDLKSVGDGRVVARTWEDGGKVIITSNGTDWTELPIPPGLEPRHVSFAGGCWLLSGTDPLLIHPDLELFWFDCPGGGRPEGAFFEQSRTDEEIPTQSDSVCRIPPREYLATRIPPGETIAERVFSSNDGGATWNELDFDITAAKMQAPPCVDHLLAYWYPELGEPTLATAKLLEQGWPSCSMASSGVESLLSTGEHIVVIERFYRDVLEAFDSSTRVFTSNASTVELVTEYEGDDIGAVSTAGGFLVEVNDAVIASPDGREWTETSLGAEEENLLFFAGVVADEIIWSAHDLEGVGSAVKKYRYGADPSTIATLRGLRVIELAVGPAGLVAKANRPDEEWVGWSADGIDWEWTTVRDAFGPIGECCDTSVQLAVGHDFVLAYLSVSGEPERLFIARVP